MQAAAARVLPTSSCLLVDQLLSNYSRTMPSNCEDEKPSDSIGAFFVWRLPTTRNMKEKETIVSEVILLKITRSPLTDCDPQHVVNEDRWRRGANRC